MDTNKSIATTTTYIAGYPTKPASLPALPAVRSESYFSPSKDIYFPSKIKIKIKKNPSSYHRGTMATLRQQVSKWQCERTGTVIPSRAIRLQAAEGWGQECMNGPSRSFEQLSGKYERTKENLVGRKA